MISVTIYPEDSAIYELISSLENVGDRIMPFTTRAIKVSAKLVMYTWKSYAMGSPIPGQATRIKNPKGAYAKSIKLVSLSPLQSEVYSDSPIAKYIENGTKQFDMKDTHPYGRRGRINKKGEPYLIIPFRHGTPGSNAPAGNKLPKQVYDLISSQIKKGEFIKKKAIEKYDDINNYGEIIQRTKYSKGSRYTAKQGESANLDGLMAFDTSSGKAKSTAFLTFRVISVNSPAHKWISPAKPAMNLTRHVVNNTKSIIEDIVGSAIKQDLGVTG